VVPSPSRPWSFWPARARSGRAREAPRLHAPSLHLPPRRDHGRATRRLTPTVGLAVQAAASSQPARMTIRGRDREPGGDVDAGHRCGYVLPSGGAVAQLAVTIGAYRDAVLSSSGKRRGCMRSHNVPPKRVHGQTRRPLTPAVGLAVLAAAGSQSTRVGSTVLDRSPAGDCGVGHKCGYEIDGIGSAVTQLAIRIKACDDAAPLTSCSCAAAAAQAHRP
jgi:hypothetical protein